MKSMLALLIGLLAVTNVAAATDTVQPATQVVHYDAGSDLISIQVQDMPLTGLLSQISRQSGVEILIVPAVNRPVSITLEDKPLEVALQTLTRGLSTVMVHDEREVPGKGKQEILIRMQLLPKGQTNTALLYPVISLEAEALMRARGLDPAAGAPVYDRASERRDARFAKLDPVKRAELEKRAQDKVDRKVQKQAEKAEKKAQRLQVKLERLTEKLESEQAHASSNPERSTRSIEQLTREIAEIQNSLSGVSPN